MSAKIALQALGSIGSAGTITTGLVFCAPKLKIAMKSNVSVAAINDMPTVPKHKNPPHQ